MLKLTNKKKIKYAEITTSKLVASSFQNYEDNFYIELLYGNFIKNTNNLQLDNFGISYDNNIFIPLDVLGVGNYFYSSLVKSNFVPCSDSKYFFQIWYLKLNFP